MINLSTFIPCSIINGPGGLFDLNVTLLLVIIQFLILTVCLNEILYKPVYLILEDREKHLLKNIKESSQILEEVNLLTFQYETILQKISEKTQIEIANSEEAQKIILKTELNYSHNSIKNWLKKVVQDSVKDEHEILKHTDQIITSLYKIIEPKLINLKSLSNI